MHGIKYTGMPAWISQTRDDEVWAVVAYLKTLDSPIAEENRPALSANDNDADTERLAAVRCAACHGVSSQAPRSALVPALQGQTPEYLAAALKAYASDERNSGIMQPVASELSSSEIQSLSLYYAKQRGFAAAASRSSGVELISLGQKLATEGQPQDGIPACESCHGANALKSYPRLSGQSARYLSSQLRLWREKRRALVGASAIMAPIAERLSDEQIEAVADFYAVAAQQRVLQ